MKRFLESNWSQIVPKMVQHFDNLERHDLQWHGADTDALLRQISKKVDMDEEQVLKTMKELITK